MTYAPISSDAATTSGDALVSADDVRSAFAQAMSEMYRQEVPQYGDLIALVADINRRTLEQDPALAERLEAQHETARLDVERHGAIRVGTAEELATLRRVFALMGMHPVSYYDLSTAGVPVHSTAFRPVDEDALSRNPFRVFTSLLRLELIEDDALRRQAASILAERDIFTPGARELIALGERQGGFDPSQAQRFVAEILETFRWHHEATVDRTTYQSLHDAHRLIADVVCFRGPHINHLTPRTLDIDAAQAAMPERDITPKAVIEGPPKRRWPILLRQTSFKALEEPVRFAGQEDGSHTARFGEIEQRGMALTPKGRALYDTLLSRSREQPSAGDNATHQRQLEDVFAEFPDDLETLRREALAYFRYRISDTGRERLAAGATPPETLDALVTEAWVEVMPITYEDFLPVSAAGIFQSNLGDASHAAYANGSSRAAFELALGRPVFDEFALYARLQDDSRAQIQRQLGLCALR
ncbi:2-oxoadipate dioxygenase/decarboxylase HglS [Salinicola avicenniae]|uniref:2-oxoadipate dioxygenase/decarboxylase HglS n=1 Tax=Salinicola avicenniae TaxID=2916836 RepID=UPI00207367C2|nr:MULTISPECIES: VOC family protein [unclassified Salinicola]